MNARIARVVQDVRCQLLRKDKVLLCLLLLLLHLHRLGVELRLLLQLCLQQGCHVWWRRQNPIARYLQGTWVSWWKSRRSHPWMLRRNGLHRRLYCRLYCMAASGRSGRGRRRATSAATSG